MFYFKRIFLVSLNNSLLFKKNPEIMSIAKKEAYNSILSLKKIGNLSSDGVKECFEGKVQETAYNAIVNTIVIDPRMIQNIQKDVFLAIFNRAFIDTYPKENDEIVRIIAF